MTQENNINPAQDKMSQGIRYIEDALNHFLDIDHEHAAILVKLLNGALVLAQLFYRMKNI